MSGFERIVQRFEGCLPSNRFQHNFTASYLDRSDWLFLYGNDFIHEDLVILSIGSLLKRSFISPGHLSFSNYCRLKHAARYHPLWMPGYPSRDMCRTGTRFPRHEVRILSSSSWLDPMLSVLKLESPNLFCVMVLYADEKKSGNRFIRPYCHG